MLVTHIIHHSQNLDRTLLYRLALFRFHNDCTIELSRVIDLRFFVYNVTICYRVVTFFFHYSSFFILLENVQSFLVMKIVLLSIEDHVTITLIVTLYLTL